MTPDYKMLFEEAMSLNAQLEQELDLTEQYALELSDQVEKLMDELQGKGDIATWGIDENGVIVNMLAQ